MARKSRKCNYGKKCYNCNEIKGERSLFWKRDYITLMERSHYVIIDSFLF